MQKNHVYLIAAIAIVTILLAATMVYYNNKSKDDDNNPVIPTPTLTTPEKPAEPFPVTITDDEGTEVTITGAPQRIISLAPSSTEVLFAVGAGDQVVGVTDFCNYPYDFAEWINEGKMNTIGNYWQPAIEPIIALEPDLVIASGGGASDEAASKLRNLGYNVIMLNPATLDDVLCNIDIIGKATGHADEATALIASLQARIDAIANKVAGISDADKPKVYIEIWDDPLMASAKGSYIDDILTIAGGVNIFADATTSYPIVSSDVVISKNPDIILTESGNVADREGWSSINAVKNNKVYDRGSDVTYVRPGPRLVDALEELAKIVHPEIFGSI
jgi:iron complex transport system substrate-binding protein